MKNKKEKKLKGRSEKEGWKEESDNLSMYLHQSLDIFEEPMSIWLLCDTLRGKVIVKL